TIFIYTLSLHDALPIYHVGVLAQGGPGLLAVDDIVIAIAHRAGLQRGQVGTGARLGVTLTPPVLPGQDARQVFLLLLFGTELDRSEEHTSELQSRENLV